MDIIRRRKNESLGAFVLRHFNMSFILWLIKKRPRYGYELIKEMQSIGFSYMNAARIYPLLFQMQKQKLITRFKKQRRVYYKIAKKGLEYLKKGKQWFRQGIKKQFFKEMVGC